MKWIPRETRNCLRCNEAFETMPHRPASYCSAHCYHEGRKEATAGRTEKPCSRCKVVKPLADFQFDKTTSDRIKAACRECTNGDYRAWFIKSRYGISLEEYATMLEQQGGVCAICGTDETFDGKSFPVDHDHTTGKVRGILCGSCNLGIGQLGDDPDRLIAAAEYLKRHALRLVS